MYTICKTFKFEAAHRLTEAYSKVCVECIHGHSYKAQVKVSVPCLNDDCMVLDFGELGSLIGPVVREMDHALILNSNTDREELSFLRLCNKKIILTSSNPTAEFLAKHICLSISPILQKRMSVRPLRIVVRVYETETGWAEYEEDA